MISNAALGAALATLTPRPLEDTFARRVPLADLLGVKAKVLPSVALRIVTPTFLLTTTKAYRYTPPDLAALYLGEGEDVAAAEVKQHPGLTGFARKPTPPHTVYHVEVKLSAVLDVTTEEAQSKLGTDLVELTAPWRLKSPCAPTQQLGGAAFADSRFEAIRYPCAPLHLVGQSGASLVIFRDRLQSGSSVKIYDPNGTWSETWPN
jgi:RES domain-containing protein